jgi:hypothetical protein
LVSKLGGEIMMAGNEMGQVSPERYMQDWLSKQSKAA